MRGSLSSCALLFALLAFAGCPDDVVDTPDAGKTGGNVLPPLRDGGIAAPGNGDGGSDPSDPNDPNDPNDPGDDPGTEPLDAGVVVVDDAGVSPALCGNDRVEPGEACDGAALDDATCRGLGFASGMLTCKSTCLDFDTDACEPLVATPIAAPGSSIQLGGSLDTSDPLWERTTESCTPSGSAGHYFEPLAIVNNTSALQSLNITASFSGDGFLHVYRAPFNPRSPTLNCGAGNDDLDGISVQSGFIELPIPAGATFVLVASTSDAADPIGSFSIEVETVGAANTCGNGTLEAGEVCDGAQLGEATCQSRGFDRGTLTCRADCQGYDESACVNDPPPQATPIAQPGGTITLNGSLDPSDGRWSRPREDCTSGPANRLYDSLAIVNQTGAPQLLRVTGSWSEDGFVHVFRAPFDANQPTTGCIVGNDDFDGLWSSQVEDVAIAPGETLVVVVSTYAADTALGAYSISVLTQQASQCGDGVREQDEVCDGADLEGETCFSQGFTGGALACRADCGAFVTRDCFTLPAAVSIAQPGSSIVLAGSLDANDPTWNRPSASCGALTTTAGRYFDTFQIRNDTGAAQSITLTASWSDDGFLHVFTTAFNSVAPTAGCVAGNDDFGGRGGSQIAELDIPAGETLVVVASTYGSSPTGGYSIEVATEQGAVCGNNIVEAGESCDGTALGGQTCSALGHSGGILSCGACALVEDNCFAFASPVAIAQPGGTVEVAGSLSASDPRWDRPTAACGGTPGDADHPFDAIPIVNNTGATREVEITADWSDDGVLHVFSSSFDSATPRTGCLAGNDDFGTSARSQIASVSIGPGETLVVVPSSFSAGESIGAYTIRVRTKTTGTTGAIPVGAPGTTLQLSGSLDTTDPTWNRLGQECGILDNPNRHYDLFRIVNETAVIQDLTITANWTSGDGFVHLVTAAFDPANPVENECLGGDDDYGEQEPSKGSRIEYQAFLDDQRINIYPGEELLVIASTFYANQAIGPYTIDVFSGGVDVSPPVAAAIAPPGQRITTAGTLHVTDPRWDRPDQCSAQAGGPVDHYFDAHYIENTTASTKDVRITATWAGGDGYLHVYAGDLFNPSSPGTCLASNDDYQGTGQSRVEEYLLGGEVLTVVASPLSGNQAIGAYSLEVETLP